MSDEETRWSDAPDEQPDLSHGVSRRPLRRRWLVFSFLIGISLAAGVATFILVLRGFIDVVRSPLLVSGRLDQRSYQDKDGNKRSAVEVVVEDFNFVGSASGRSDNSSPSAPSSNQSTNSKSQDVVIEDIDDKPIDLSEIPF